MDLQTQIDELRGVVYGHQHTGGDFTQTLRNQDLQQLGRTVLAVAATSISVTIPTKRVLRVHLTWGAKSGASDDYLTFNSDSGGNYSFFNQGAAARTSQARIDIRDGANSALGGFCVIHVANNLSSLVKSLILHTVDKITAAATTQTFYQIFGTWVNTSAFITTVTLTSSNAKTYPVGTELLVYGSRE